MENGIRVYFTREFTGGILKGLRVIDSVNYPTVEQCAVFIAKGRKGFKKWAYGDANRIIDASFQNYQRN